MEKRNKRGPKKGKTSKTKTDSAMILLDELEILKQSFSSLSGDSGRSFGPSWCAWKENFLSFLKKDEIKELYKDNWTSLLLTLIGKQDHMDISSAQQMKDFETLICDLDLYFIFGNRRKPKDESIDKYIDSLMLVAIASNHKDPVKIVKEKIIRDMKSHNFAQKAIFLIQSKGENFELYLKSLDLYKIILFWKQCECLTLQEDDEINCIRCGTQHIKNRCPAHGQRCDNCMGFNHFTHYCKTKYVSNCTKCGTSHAQSRCLAFGEVCVNCGRTNHFTWLCQVPIVKNCIRCGTDHALSACPAQGHLCVRCNKPNHLEKRCISKMDR